MAKWQINEQVNALQGFHLGDSAEHEQRRTWQSFFAEIDRCKELDMPWTLQLRDPLSNSFVSSVLDDPRKDPRMQVTIPCCATIGFLVKGSFHVAVARALLQRFISHYFDGSIPQQHHMLRCFCHAKRRKDVQCSLRPPCVMLLLLLQIEDYERTEDEDEHFGIDHLKAEDAKEYAAERRSAGIDAAEDNGIEKHDTGSKNEVEKTSE